MILTLLLINIWLAAVVILDHQRIKYLTEQNIKLEAQVKYFSKPNPLTRT
jgi:hypothetical protein